MNSVSDKPPTVVPNTARAREAAAAANHSTDRPTADIGETRAERLHRTALRGRLHGYAILTVGLVALLIALAASNTASVKVNWLVGNSHVSLVWLVLATAIVAFLLGLLTSARVNWRTRPPRRSKPNAV